MAMLLSGSEGFVVQSDFHEYSRCLPSQLNLSVTRRCVRAVEKSDTTSLFAQTSRLTLMLCVSLPEIAEQRPGAWEREAAKRDDRFPRHPQECKREGLTYLVSFRVGPCKCKEHGMTKRGRARRHRGFRPRDRPCESCGRANDCFRR